MAGLSAPRCKNCDSPFHLPMSVWEVLPPGEWASLDLNFQTSGQAAVARSTLVFQPMDETRIVFIKQKTFQRASAR